MVMTIENPEILRRAGLRHLGRVRQAHLDFLLQGVILTVVGLAIDPLPTWIGFLLVLGAFLAPLLLGVLALDSEQQKGSRLYRGSTPWCWSASRSAG
jgi:hypothetical protein